MGLFGWVYDNFLMSEEEKRRKASVEAYSREMKAHWAVYRPQLEEARARWANTEKELYRTYGIHLSDDDGEAGDGQASQAEQDEYEDCKEQLRAQKELLQEAIDGYSSATREMKRYYSNPN